MKNKQIKNYKIFSYSFCFVVLVYIFLFLSIPVLAAETTFIPQVKIGEYNVGVGTAITKTSIGDYINAIYKWAVGALIVLAVVMIMVAGFQWMTAGGSGSAITKAKGRITQALIGLLLGIGAYTLLNFINPSLVNLRDIKLGNVEGVETKSPENKMYLYNKKENIVRVSENECEIVSIVKIGKQGDFFAVEDKDCGAIGHTVFTINIPGAGTTRTEIKEIGTKCSEGVCMINKVYLSQEKYLTSNRFTKAQCAKFSKEIFCPKNCPIENDLKKCSGLVSIAPQVYTGPRVMAFLAPKAKSAFDAFMGKWLGGRNGRITISSMFRNPNYQCCLYNEDLDANYPGKSTHEKGIAFDVNLHVDPFTGSKDKYTKFLDMAKSFGFKVADTEAWHFTYQGGGGATCNSSF